jgi:hypothetical protein
VHVRVRRAAEERVQEADVAADWTAEGVVRVRLAGRAERVRNRAGCARRPEMNVSGGRRPAQVLEGQVPDERAGLAFERDRRGEGAGPEAASFAFGAARAVLSVAFRA